jgi:hypothetical protein
MISEIQLEILTDDPSKELVRNVMRPVSLLSSSNQIDSAPH